jgi:hypothetical protein
MTSEGEETLKFFGNRINPAIKTQIDEYLRENSMKLRDEGSILGDYTKTAENEYTAQLIANENGQSIVEIKLAVPTEEIARNICKKWQDCNQEVYQYLMETLMSD